MKLQKLPNKLLVLTSGLLVVVVFVSTLGSASAATITGRKVTLSNSSGAASSVAYTFASDALPTTGTPVQAVAGVVCTTASGSCTTPTGFTAAAGTISGQPTGLGAASGWTDDSITGEIRIINAANATNPSGAVSIPWATITNPTANNTTYFIRFTTYLDEDYGGGDILDTGVVAVSTAQAITLTGTMPELLTFCTGTSITGTDCGTASGSSVSFGEFSPSSTSTGTSLMVASTNAQSGYAITINGTTMTSGGNTISALAAATASSTGTEQFGTNLRDNATPNIGADVSGASGTSYGSGYGTADNFKFVTGETIASRTNAGDASKFTNSYIVNVAGSTEAGIYTAVMTYICTATF